MPRSLLPAVDSVEKRLSHDLEVGFLVEHVKRERAESMRDTLLLAVFFLFATNVATLLVAIVTHHSRT